MNGKIPDNPCAVVKATNGSCEYEIAMVYSNRMYTFHAWVRGFPLVSIPIEPDVVASLLSVETLNQIDNNIVVISAGKEVEPFKLSNLWFASVESGGLILVTKYNIMGDVHFVWCVPMAVLSKLRDAYLLIHNSL